MANVPLGAERADESTRDERAHHVRYGPDEIEHAHHDAEPDPASLAPKAPRGYPTDHRHGTYRRGRTEHQDYAKRCFARGGRGYTKSENEAGAEDGLEANRPLSDTFGGGAADG